LSESDPLGKEVLRIATVVIVIVSPRLLRALARRK
jgi:hypothetical protein